MNRQSHNPGRQSQNSQNQNPQRQSQNSQGQNPQRQSQMSQNQDSQRQSQNSQDQDSQRQSQNSQGQNSQRQSQTLPDKNYDYEFTLDSYNLNEEVKVKLLQARQGPKVAFLSGCERRYYPEYPGTSKFALRFKEGRADPTLPPPRFLIPAFQDRLTKPISKKGYGIGGLSGPRFPPLEGGKIPAPNQYQKYSNEVLTRQHKFPPQVWMHYGLLGPNDKIWDAKVARKLVSLWGKCHQIKVGFGTSTKRFGKKPKWNLAGPGNYTIRELQLQPPTVFNSFLRGPTTFNSPTKLHCSYGPKDKCLECDTELMGERDYYRSRFRVNPIPFRPIIEDTEQHILQAMSQVNKKEDNTNTKAKRVLLCRSCYCTALRGQGRYWKTRAEVQRLFEKARHCGYIHEHNGLPDYTLKASCYWTRKLGHKEAVLSKHYKDKCEKRIVG